MSLVRRFPLANGQSVTVPTAALTPVRRAPQGPWPAAVLQAKPAKPLFPQPPQSVRRAVPATPPALRVPGTAGRALPTQPASVPGVSTPPGSRRFGGVQVPSDKLGGGPRMGLAADFRVLGPGRPAMAQPIQRKIIIGDARGLGGDGAKFVEVMNWLHSANLELSAEEAKRVLALVLDPQLHRVKVDGQTKFLSDLRGEIDMAGNIQKRQVIDDFYRRLRSQCGLPAGVDEFPIHPFSTKPPLDLSPTPRGSTAMTYGQRKTTELIARGCSFISSVAPEKGILGMGGRVLGVLSGAVEKYLERPQQGGMSASDGK